MSKNPNVFLVGAGPGDAGLITVRGLALLRSADVIVYDALCSRAFLNEAKAGAELIYVGKKAGLHSLPQGKINELLVAKASEGKIVVRLKGGDPYVFGRGGEEAMALVKAGIAFEVVPGVTAGVAAAAYAGIPVTHRDYASEVAFITGHQAEGLGSPGSEGDDDLGIDWEALGRWRGTLVFYMGVKNLSLICEKLQSYGMSGKTPAAIIQWGTTAQQRTLIATVATLADEAARQHFEAPAVTVVGRVVELRDSLSWFERRPLFGRRIVVTRPKAQSRGLSEGLASLGAEVLELPVIRIEPPSDVEPMRQAISNLSNYQWVIFTSVNGVQSFFDELRNMGRDSRALGGVRVAAIGPSTAESLMQQGIHPDLMPDSYTTDTVAAAMIDKFDLKGSRILLPRADLAREELADRLEQHGAIIEQVIAYRTVPDGQPADEVIEAISRDAVDWVTLTSSSSVRRFFAKISPDRFKGKKVRFASIGPITTQTLRIFGFAPALEADQYTIPGLIEAICCSETHAAHRQ